MLGPAETDSLGTVTTSAGRIDRRIGVGAYL
jgi:hypothetical protein